MGKINQRLNPGKPFVPKRRFVMIDPKLIDKGLLYFDSANKPLIGLILERSAMRAVSSLSGKPRRLS